MQRRDFLKTLAAGSVAWAAGSAGSPGRVEARARLRRSIHVLVWDEQQDRQVTSGAYPNFLGNAVAEFLSKTSEIEVVSASIKEPEQGLSEERIAWADVFVWWGHVRHGDVDDSKVEAVVAKVRAAAAGFVTLHSAHYSKPFKRLLGAPCGFRRVDDNHGQGYTQYLRVTNPLHPIAAGVEDFEIPRTEIYAEPFEVPMPEAIPLYGYWDTGESFPDCCCWTVGPQGVPTSAQAKVKGGRVCYFRPGHETFPIFQQPEVQRVVTNAVRWAAPSV